MRENFFAPVKFSCEAFLPVQSAAAPVAYYLDNYLRQEHQNRSILQFKIIKFPENSHLHLNNVLLAVGGVTNTDKVGTNGDYALE